MLRITLTPKGMSSRETEGHNLQTIEDPPPKRGTAIGLRKNAITLFGVVATTCAFMGPATSIYFNTGLGVRSCGNAFGFALLIAMVTMLLVAHVIAEFAKKIPTSGFGYTFSVQGLGPKAGFVVGWVLVGGYAMIGPMMLAAISYFLGQFCNNYLGLNINWAVFAVVIAGLTLFVSSRAIAMSVRVALIMLVIEVVIMTLFFLTILLKGGAEGTTLAAFNPANTLRPHDVDGIGDAVMWAILMFVGFESAATLGEETQDAKRNIPRALMLCVAGVGIFYMLGAFAAVVGYGPGHVQKVVASIDAGQNPWDPLLARFWGKGGSAMITLVIVNSIFANLLSGFNSVVRILYAMGRERVLPSFLGTVVPKTQVPLNAAIFYMSLSLAVTLVLGHRWNPMTVYMWSGTALGLAIVIVYMMVAVSLYCFYRRRPSEFNWLQHALLPALAALVLCLPLRGVVASTLPSGGGIAPMTYIPYLGIAWVVLGSLYTGYLTRFKSELLLSMGKVFEGS